MKMNIKDIMEQMQETPSPRCWESIASQLPAAGAAAGGSAAATAAKGAMSAGKLAAIIGSASAVVAIVTGTTIAILTHEPAIVPQPNPETTATVVVADNTEMVTEDMPDITEFVPAEAPAVTETAAIASNKTEKTADEPAQSTQANPTVIAANPSTAMVSTPAQTTPTATTISASPNPSVGNANASGKNTSANATTKHDKPVAVSEQEEKSENDNPWEEAGYSRPITIEIPNIFTPNGDGVNDKFVINGLENCEKKTLLVKDRSGKIIFQSQNYDNSWDGGNLPNGTYYYQFNYSINNINELRQGAVLIRR
ncbi:MAG: gliding motility-associated C-terminal domain-containing protein [Bacteroidales bacterium]|nr:gliding motility-associated C-terminal domain-containing protein [Bacteroidales bacterium]